MLASVASASISSSAAASSSPFLFVYGTLMSPLVLSALLGRIPTMITDATLADYARFPVRHQTYPAIVPRAGGDGGASVRGIVLPDLTSKELEILDGFEGDEYERRSVFVTIITPTSTTNSLDPQRRMLQQTVPAFTYVCTNPETELDFEHGEWDFDLFCQNHLQEFVERFANPRQGGDHE